MLRFLSTRRFKLQQSSAKHSLIIINRDVEGVFYTVITPSSASQKDENRIRPPARAHSPTCLPFKLLKPLGKLFLNTSAGFMTSLLKIFCYV